MSQRRDYRAEAKRQRPEIDPSGVTGRSPGYKLVAPTPRPLGWFDRLREWLDRRRHW